MNSNDYDFSCVVIFIFMFFYSRYKDFMKDCPNGVLKKTVSCFTQKDEYTL